MTGRLIYLVATPDGGVDWPVVDDQLHTWFNDQMRGPGRVAYVPS